jgi:hypothetical protein
LKTTHNKNPVFSRNRVFRYSIALNQTYNYFTLEIPVKSLFASGLLGLAAGVINRSLSLTEVLAVGEITLLTVVPIEGIIG